MTRNTLNFLIDAVTAAIMLGMIATGLIIRFVLPPGSGSARGLWALNRHEWGDVHFWLAVAAGVTVLLHLALHWQWVTVMVARLLTRRSANEIPGRLRRNVAGVLISTVDTNERLYDGTRDWRDRAMRGTFHSGTPVRDRRSDTRTQL